MNQILGYENRRVSVGLQIFFDAETTSYSYQFSLNAYIPCFPVWKTWGLKNKTVKVKQRLNRIKALKFFCFRKYENTIHSATLDKNVFSEENS